jgi:hypothetical protein
MIRSVFIALFAMFGYMMLMTACRSEDSVNINQDRIWTFYELNYDRSTNQTTVRATFRFGNSTGTLLELTSPSEVRFNNDVLTFDNTSKIYQRQYNGLIDSGTFLFRDTQNKTYSNTVNLRQAEFPANPAVLTLSRNQDFSLLWSGAPLQNGDVVQVGIINQNPPALFVQNSPGATSIVLRSDQLRALPSGTYNATISRTSLISTLNQAPPAGGQVRTQFIGANRSVQIN